MNNFNNNMIMNNNINNQNNNMMNFFNNMIMNNMNMNNNMITTNNNANSINNMNNINNNLNNNANLKNDDNNDTIMEDKEIFLTFTFKKKNEQVYIDVNGDEIFNNVIIKLEKKYQWIKDIPNRQYYNKSKKIDPTKSINDLKLKNNSDITVI